MKISNETKVGALTSVAITVLVIGFNALKGKNLFKRPKKIYAIFENTSGLPNSAPVMYRGLQIGVTGDKEEADAYASKIIVPITLTKDIFIPKNSIAIISGSTLGLSASILEIKPGSDTKFFLTSGDTIQTSAATDLIDLVSKQFNPVLGEVKNVAHSLDSVLKVIGGTFDPNTKSNFQSILANVNRTTANLIVSSASLQELLNMQSGKLAQSLNHVNSFTENLDKNKEKITNAMGNLEKASEKIAGLKLDESLDNLNNTIKELQEVIHRFNNDKGTLGKLINDPDLYNQLHSVTYSINTLIDDLKVNPKRYLSIFGRKDRKIKPLTRPLSDSIPH